MLGTVAVVVKTDSSNYTVIIERADCELHARLAAWYYVHGASKESPDDRILMDRTELHHTMGPVSAQIYVNPYGTHDA